MAQRSPQPRPPPGPELRLRRPERWHRRGGAEAGTALNSLAAAAAGHRDPSHGAGFRRVGSAVAVCPAPRHVESRVLGPLRAARCGWAPPRLPDLHTAVPAQMRAVYLPLPAQMVSLELWEVQPLGDSEPASLFSLSASPHFPPPSCSLLVHPSLLLGLPAVRAPHLASSCTTLTAIPTEKSSSAGCL